jgi:hypothetical protein
MANLNNAISNIVSSNKKAVAVFLDNKDNRDVIEFKFNDGVVITTEIGKFGYEGLYNFTDPQTYFYDYKDPIPIHESGIARLQDLAWYNDSIVITIEDGSDGAFGIHPNMRIWNGPEKKEYILSGDDLEDMFSTYWRIIKENINIETGSIRFIDKRAKPEYDEIF